MPKRFGFLYEKMLDKEYIRRMILRASKNKRNRKDVQKVLGYLDEGVDTISIYFSLKHISHQNQSTSGYMTKVDRKNEIFTMLNSFLMLLSNG